MIGDGEGEGTITNDDAAELTITDVTLAEGDAGVTNFVFTVSSSSAVDTAYSVDYATADQTAGTADYMNFTGAANESFDITVPVLAEELVELDETFVIDLSNLQAGSLDVSVTDPQGLGTITNDDQAIVSLTVVDLAEGDSGSSNLVYTATLTGQVDVPVVADFATSNGTATAGQDYTSVSSSALAILEAGTLINVAVSGDEVVELDETLSGTLSALNAQGRDVIFTGAQSTLGVTGTITNDDSSVIAITDVTLAEGDTGTTNFVFTVSATSAVDTGYSVDFASALDTAQAEDFGAVGGTLNFAGTLNESMNITVPVVTDEVVELDETFFVNLSNIVATGRNVTFTDSQGLGTITNDDMAELTIDDVTLAEGDAGTTSFVFTVTLDDALDMPFTVDYASADGSADGGDYLATNGTLNFVGDAGPNRYRNCQRG